MSTEHPRRGTSTALPLAQTTPSPGDLISQLTGLVNVVHDIRARTFAVLQREHAEAYQTWQTHRHDLREIVTDTASCLRTWLCNALPESMIGTVDADIQAAEDATVA